MSSTDVQRLSTPAPPRAAEFTGQATAIEQARAVAEVQAAVYVAQQMRRDLGRAVADMRDACGRIALAERAFYSVPNRGNGASVHLARELVRIWGNADYGVHELRRDDAAGVSEIRAFAWDQESNVRSSRTFIVPHARMKKINGKQTREPLVDLADVYSNNQNIGARAVRETIFTIIPAWFRDEAESLCRQTLENGEGKPRGQRIDEMVKAFAALGVKVDQLEHKIGRNRGSWTPADLADMRVRYKSLQSGEVSQDDEFPQRRVTADEVTSRAPATTTASGQPAETPALTSQEDHAREAWPETPEIPK